MIDPEDLQNQLQKALRECALLREENERLKKLLGLPHEGRAPTPRPSIPKPSTPYIPTEPPVASYFSIEEKIVLFRPAGRDG